MNVVDHARWRLGTEADIVMNTQGGDKVVFIVEDWENAQPAWRHRVRDMMSALGRQGFEVTCED